MEWLRFRERANDSLQAGALVTMKLNRHSVGSLLNPPVQKTIPFSCCRIGSWEVAISRRPRAPEELASRYDAVSASWRRTARRFQLESAYREPLLACGAKPILGSAGSEARVLDCGIGCGTLSLALSSILPDRIAYYGIDMSGEMLATADVAMRQTGLSPQLKQADILSIPYADRSFDFVMAAHVLEHLPEPGRALDEMVRILKPGGMVFVCMTRRSVFGALIQLRWRTWAITEREGVAWLQDCQLADIGFRPVDLGSCAGKASMAFWARRPANLQIEPPVPNREKAP